MTLSKFTFISFAVIFFYSFQRDDRDKKQKLTLTASVYKRETIDSINHLLIRATLTNNSSNTFSYIVMSCYHPFFYKIVPNNFIIQTEEDCDKNVPELISIPPHKHIETIISLPIKKNVSQFYDTAFRIGIYLKTANDAVNLPKRTHLLLMNPHGVSSKEYDINPLSDTSYNIRINFTTEKDGTVKQLDTSAMVNFLWSNTVKL